MTAAITNTNGLDMSAIEQVLVGGDLSKLTAAQRVTYYKATCESLGLNPLTRPLEWIVLNGKLTQYMRKDGTDQLRSNRKVSIQIVSKEKIDEVYVVTARASMPDGRADEATGAVNLANLRGENLANALMKAETKAKRRVTLSICGLGIVDESEIDSIPGAQRVNVNLETGEIEDPIAQAAAHASVDFDSLLDGASTLDELKAVAKDINEAGKSGRLDPNVRRALGEKYKARSAALNGAAA
jgi:hypothetical protein